MDKKTLLRKCSALGIIGISSKPKHEIIKILEDQAKLYDILNFEIQDTPNHDNTHTQTPIKYKKTHDNPIETEYHNSLQDILTQAHSHINHNTINNFDTNTYLLNITHNTCNDCNKIFIHSNNYHHKIWQNKTLCETCWHKYSTQRNELWTLIHNRTNYTCNICNITYNDDNNNNNIGKFHFDHINMFDKTHNIFEMVNNGHHIQDIYNEIDKCQILCIPCHHIITDIEYKLGFTNAKIYLNKSLINNIITHTQYHDNINTLKNIYHDKMQTIYKQLQTYFTHKTI